MERKFYDDLADRLVSWSEELGRIAQRNVEAPYLEIVERGKADFERCRDLREAAQGLRALQAIFDKERMQEARR